MIELGEQDHLTQPLSQVADAVRNALSCTAGEAVKRAFPLALACCAISTDASAQALIEADDEAEKSDDSADDGAVQLDEIVVRGKVTLRHKEAYSATKMDMELKDIAQSVTVITEDLMDMADVQMVQDIYRIDASVGSTHRTDSYPTNVFRGYTITGDNALRVDGFRFPGNVDVDLATFERFELVKGPTSSLFGQNSVGGTINAVSKQPTRERIAEIGLEVGSFDAYRLDVDLGNELSADGRWQYRLLGVYRDSDTYIDFTSDKAYVLAPSVGFDLSDRTRVVATLNVQEHEDSNHWGTGLQQYAPGQYRVLPSYRGHNFGQPWNRRDTESVLGTVKVSHNFNNGWELRFNAQGSTVDKYAHSCSGDGNANADGLIEAGCWTYLREEDEDMFGGEVNLIGDISLMGREHTLFFGADYTNIRYESRFGYDYIDDDGNHLPDSSVGFQLLPGPSTIQEDFEDSDLYYFSDDIDETVFAGVTIQALANPTDRLQVLLSGRFTFDDIVESSERGAGSLDDLVNTPFDRQTDRELSTNEFVPQIGVTYRVSDNVNVYANWGETYDSTTLGLRMFDPDNPDGVPLPSEEGEQIEVGLKADILNDRASITAAIFDMERSGITTVDRINDGYFLPLGTQEVLGAEFAINGSLTDSIDVFWSASYLDAVYKGGDDIVGGDAAPDGARPVNTPKWASSLYMSYSVLNGALEGLNVGVGWVYKDRYPGWGRVFDGGDAAGGVHVDLGSVNEVDIRLQYETDNWDYFVAVMDVFDDKYYSPYRAEYRWGVSVNPGRRYRAGVSYRF